MCLSCYVERITIFTMNGKEEIDFDFDNLIFEFIYIFGAKDV